MPEDQSRPARALAVSIEDRIDLHQVQTRDNGALPGQSRAARYFVAWNPRWVGGADSRHVRRADDVCVDGDRDVATLVHQPVQLSTEVLVQAGRHLVPP